MNRGEPTLSTPKRPMTLLRPRRHDEVGERLRPGRVHLGPPGRAHLDHVVHVQEERLSLRQDLEGERPGLVSRQERARDPRACSRPSPTPRSACRPCRARSAGTSSDPPDRSRPPSRGPSPWSASRSCRLSTGTAPRLARSSSARPSTSSMPRILAGSPGGPTMTKSLCMTSRRFTPCPSATSFCSSAGEWTSRTSASPFLPIAMRLAGADRDGLHEVAGLLLEDRHEDVEQPRVLRAGGGREDHGLGVVRRGAAGEPAKRRTARARRKIDEARCRVGSRSVRSSLREGRHSRRTQTVTAARPRPEREAGRGRAPRRSSRAARGVPPRSAPRPRTRGTGSRAGAP